MTFQRTVVVLVVVMSAVRLSAQNADVNAERVSMDMQMLRAMRGDAMLGSMSVWPQSMVDVQTLAADTSDAFGRYLHAYYAPVLSGADSTSGADFARTSNDRFRMLRYNDGTASLMGDAALMVRGGYTDDGTANGPFALVRPSVRLMGNFDIGLAYFLDLSNGMRLTGDPMMIARTDPTLSRTLKFVQEEQKFFDRYIGYVQYQSKYFRMRFGREAVQFGFSPIDNFVHSLNAPPMDGLLIDVPYKSVRFTSTHSQVDGLDTAGNAIKGKFIATHRLAIDPVPWLSVAVSDMIVYWGRSLDFSYLNPLAFFVSAGLGTQERSQNDNSILGFDIAVRPMPGTLIYGSLMIDDLAWETIGDTSQVGNNNKNALQIGVSQLVDAHGAPTQFTVEYAYISPFTFSHRSINASYTHLGAFAGYNMQPNSDRIAFQVRHWFTPRTFVKVDMDYTRHGDNFLDSTGNIVMGEDPRFPGSGAMTPVGNVGGDILRGDGDFLYGNSFLKGNFSTTRRINVWFSAEWIKNLFTDLRIGYSNTSGGNTPGSFLFGSLEVRIGY